MANFSVVILTAPPPGQMSEAGGALLRVDGKEAVLRASELFLNRDEIKQILVVFQPDEADNARKKFGSHFAFTGIKTTVGGPRWLDQVAASLEKLSPEATHVLVHDAARCCVPYSDIDALLAETAKAPTAVALTAPSRTSLLELDEGGNAAAYHLPTRFVQLLTPQGFTRKAFETMATKKQEVHASGLRLIHGSPLNVRLGFPGDEKLVRTMLGMLPKPIKNSDGPFQEAQW